MGGSREAYVVSSAATMAACASAEQVKCVVISVVNVNVFVCLCVSFRLFFFAYIDLFVYFRGCDIIRYLPFLCVYFYLFTFVAVVSFNPIWIYSEVGLLLISLTFIIQQKRFCF